MLQADDRGGLRSSEPFALTVCSFAAPGVKREAEEEEGHQAPLHIASGALAA
jgi:hypothetical protein